MSQHDTKTATPPSTALILLMTILGSVLIVVALIAVLATNPVNWFGVGVAVFAGAYSLLMAQLVKRRSAQRN